MHWPMLFVTAGMIAGAALVVRSAGDSNPSFRLAVLSAIAVAALYSAWQYFRTTEASAVEVAMRSLQFRGDEAINLLRSCASLTAEPHLFLLDMLGGPVAPRGRAPRDPPLGRPARWFDRVLAARSAIWRALWNAAAAWSDFWNGRLRRAVERAASEAYRVPVLGSLWALVLIMGFRPYRPRLRPFISARMPRLSRLFFHAMEEETDRTMRETAAVKPWQSKVFDPFKNTMLDPDFPRQLAAFLAATVYLLLFPIDKLLGIPAWLGAVGTRFAILIGARAAAGGAPGMDMLGAAYDPSRTDLPDQVRPVEIPEAIERDIEQRLADTSRVEVTTLRAAFDPAKRASLPAAIKTAFSDVGLLHAQYYQDARVVDFIAQCIAGTESPEWRVDRPPAAEVKSQQ